MLHRGTHTVVEIQRDKQSYCYTEGHTFSDIENVTHIYCISEAHKHFLMYVLQIYLLIFGRTHTFADKQKDKHSC